MGYRVITGTIPGSGNFSYTYIDDLNNQQKEIVNQLKQIYGSLVIPETGNTKVITLAGMKITSSDMKITDSLAENFELAGLFEGVTQIYDEEGTSQIANGIWCNGVLYIPTTVEGGIERKCLGTFYVAEAKLNDPLSSLVKAETGVFYGSTAGIAYADLVDILSESGLTIKPIDCSNQVQSPTTLPGLKAQCDTTQLWLNG